MAYTRDWDESQPTDSEYGYTTGGWFRKVKIDVAERLKDWIYGFISGETKIGLKKAPLHPVSSDPATESDKGILYVKEVGGVKELFYKDSSGNIKQLTSQGKLNLTDEGVVYVSGDQTISGVKTFNDRPVLPGDYVDLSNNQSIGGDKTFIGSVNVNSLTSTNDIETTSGMLKGKIIGTKEDKARENGYLASSDGLVVAIIEINYASLASHGARLLGQISSDGTNWRTVAASMFIRRNGDGWDATINTGSICFPVKKGQYWRVLFQSYISTGESSSVTLSQDKVYWYPLGA